MSNLILDPTVIPLLAEETRVARECFGRVSPGRLSADGVRAQFLRSDKLWQPEMAGDRLDRPSHGLKPASVLVPLVERKCGLAVLLTQRTAHLAAHAGQISFPGGRAEPEDLDAVATALREAQEEVGLNPAVVEVVGTLPTYITISAYEVTPVVGLIREPLHLQHDPWEVAEVFEVPLSFLMNPENHECRGDVRAGGKRSFYAIPWTVPDAERREYFIWGATAAMLRNLYRFLVA